MQKQILIAPNAFKNSLSAIDVAYAIKEGLQGLSCQTKILPIADGGDGTIDIIKQYLKKSKYVNCIVHDPLMRKIKSKWLCLNREIAVIELAKASGIVLLKRNELNPLLASTYGTGELVLDALNKGCKKFIISLGGSATVDAGIGILSALGVRFLNKKNEELLPCGKSLKLIHKIDFRCLDKRVKQSEFIVLCDVQNPLLGKYGAVACYAQQKGANKKMRLLLEKGMKNYINVIEEIEKIEKNTRKKYFKLPMTGSAGGVAYSLFVILNAKLYQGFDYLAKLFPIKHEVKNADLIITGEGYLDKQTMYGKGVYKLLDLAKLLHKPVVIVCGNYDRKVDWEKIGIEHVFAIQEKGISALKSMQKAKQLIVKKVKSNSKIFVSAYHRLAHE
ncbi:MAG: glycerate kinase [Candidatus Melainabacteria bacterium]|nr:glycerate kinase [Candidatus Melainabacteria bacterium]MBI3309159.1 glycerate kinase [Candidatus Melainabacteria bacterium]